MRYFVVLAVAILPAVVALSGPWGRAQERQRPPGDMHPSPHQFVPPPAPKPSPDGANTALSVAQEQALKAKDTFKECTDCPEMVVVPAGSFMMGSPEWEQGRESATRGSESPQHLVTIARPFAVGRFEVTFAEWDACVAEGGCYHRPQDGESGQPGWGREKRPVINVSWTDATQQYLPWLSRKTGKAYRLLTEAEWEYVARAGSTTRFFFGDSEGDLCTHGNVGDLTTKQVKPGWLVANCRDGYVYTAPVGSFQPNAFGLYDVHGNVWEWVQDCWNGGHFGAPSDGSARLTGDCRNRIYRGGSWADAPWLQRSANRSKFSPDGRFIDIGFRVARSF